MNELRRLRIRLTIWYVGVFALVLIAFGGALFAVLTRQISQRMDRSLLRTANAVATVARDESLTRIGLLASEGNPTNRIGMESTGRMIYVFDDTQALVFPDTAGAWIRDIAHEARQGATVVREHEFPNEVSWRALARPFDLGGGARYVTVVCADVVELDDQYAGLLLAFLIGALVALAGIALGGWLVAGRSIAPVRDSFQRMRGFMADAAHELRTPMTVIDGNAEIALRGSRSSAEYRDALGTIHAEASRLSGILDNLLTIARADAGAWPVHPQSLFLDDLLLDVTQNVQVLAQRSHTRLNVVSFDELPVRGDPDLLRQLLMILLDNALTHGSTGGCIEIAARREENRATLVVADYGPGMPPEVLAHVFDRFYRGDPARQRKSGTGLGLSIARWIVDVHDADIEIDSKLQHGTRVTLHFPIEGDPHE
jgi:signal transduction histidine kinase